MSKDFLKKYDFRCPSLEEGSVHSPLDQKIWENFSDKDYVKKAMEENKSKNLNGIYVLPLWQNTEAVVLAEQIKGDQVTWKPGKYCISSLDEFDGLSLNLTDHRVIKTMLSIIEEQKDDPMIFEVMAPFSILGAMINPMTLYSCILSEKEKLREVLSAIAKLEASYIEKAIQAGVKVLSMADPIGTVNMVGKDAFGEQIAPSELELLSLIRPSLKHAVVHLCKKMSLSLLITEKISARDYEPKGTSSNVYDILREMAEDETICFTGLSCIHQKNRFTSGTKVITLIKDEMCK